METLFAKVNAQGGVENVIVAEQSFIDTLVDSTSYVQTFADASGDATRGYNYASIGGRYDPANNAFVDVQPFKSWVLDAKFKWVAPRPMPEPRGGVYYTWDEAAVDWKEVVVPAAA